MWRSEQEMLDVVRRRAGDRRRRRRLFTATMATGVVVAVAIGAVALAGGGDGKREISVAGGGLGSGTAGARGGVAQGASPFPTSGVSPTTAVGAEAAGGEATTTTRPGVVTTAPAAAAEPETTTPTSGGSSGAGSSAPSAPSSASGPSPDTPVSTVVPPPPGGGGGPSGGQPQRVTPSSSALELRPHAFESAEAVGERTVAVRFWSGVAPCSVLGRVDVHEASDRVTITLSVGREPTPEPVACIAIAAYYEVLVELPSPLAGRTIVDGAA